LSEAIDTPTAILKQLRLNQDRNLLTVLIFDQFEEFFFAYRDLIGRRELYDFLAECLNQISDLKIILSLREDYLFYLLEFNRATNLSIIDNDILTKKICYYLGNFSISDAKDIVQTLTKGSQFYLDDDLANALVADLAGEVGEVRPIELQIVGMQLEKRQITRLSEYQQLGSQAKLKLVEEFLDEVIADCGKENKNIAQVVLYLLTDENATRPQKTLAALAAYLPIELVELELVLEMIVKSGLVLEVPGTPKRYQLVHDYLVPFVRHQWINAKLLETRENFKHIIALIQTIEERTETIEERTEDWKQLLAQPEAEGKELFAKAEAEGKELNAWLTIILATILSITLIEAFLIMGVA
jgi:chorismate mutase